MTDYIVRATAADAAIRAFAITSREMVETAREDHNTSPIMTAALGRLLSGGAMMGTMLKGEKDLLTLQIQCSGPAKGLTVTADSKGNVKGFALNPVVELPPNQQGHLNVGGALDLGILSVIKDMGMKEPYVGQCQLQTGEIAEDLTYYFATSEQIPSAVGLGVLMNPDNTVKQAGGFIIQLMPFTSDEVIDKLEKKIQEIDSVTMMLERGLSPEGILDEILGEFGVEIVDKIPTAFVCDCSKEKVSRALATISKKDMDSIINDGEGIEVKCQFCNQAYHFDIDELKELRK
ncbi:MAG: Hsp33 family molecular chaperone HslO [Lachnospiraceae bacterium]|nr:Hsp33 family molecular chaperone HslO [Lachnospiraceae bacterium]